MGMYPSAMANPGLHAVCTQLRSTYLPINRQVHTKHFTFHDLTSLPLPISTHTHIHTRAFLHTDPFSNTRNRVPTIHTPTPPLSQAA
jgi:hypothetical protein